MSLSVCLSQNLMVRIMLSWHFGNNDLDLWAGELYSYLKIKKSAYKLKTAGNNVKFYTLITSDWFCGSNERLNLGLSREPTVCALQIFWSCPLTSRAEIKLMAACGVRVVLQHSVILILLLFHWFVGRKSLCGEATGCEHLLRTTTGRIQQRDGQRRSAVSPRDGNVRIRYDTIRYIKTVRC